VKNHAFIDGNKRIAAAQRAYESLGFQHVGDYCILLLKGAVHDD